ncbi:DUF2846 domain-containing protein [Microbulbifer sp. Q7]|uniref:DUF2846 domain-containing protein n=1 Tax=Microbulbifer sp. Q7 TaxID=1785091 RepID=UPI0008332805|nr:DUF2846 domain-containing protein [Microbulbifer sp. Q7]
MKKLSIAILAMLLSGCIWTVAKGPVFSGLDEAKESKSVVYIYKKYSDDGVTACLKFLLNEAEHGCLWGQGFLRAEVSPGEQELVLQTNAFMGPRLIEYKFTAEPGKTYFYEFIFTSGNVTDDALAIKKIGLGLTDGRTHVFSSGAHALYQKETEVAIKDLVPLKESI